MEISKINLTEEEFKSIELNPYSNLVVVEMPRYEGDKKTDSGVIYGFNPDVQYAEGKENHIADVADVYGTVVKQPKEFYFKRGTSYSPSWKTTIETEIGDLVWFNPLVAVNCTEIHVNQRTYKLIPYEDLFVAKRKIEIQDAIIDKNADDFFRQYGMSVCVPRFIDDVICLNGYCIVERVKQKSLGSLDVLSSKKTDESRGIIKYCGSCNLEYENKRWTDFVDLRAGDEVLFAKSHKPIPLEHKSYNAHFDNGKLYYAVQRRFITMVC
jgi:hypothetical protein